MKHCDLSQEAEQLRQLCEEAGLMLDALHARILVEYLRWLLDENARLNLTAVLNWNDALRLHLVDSLSAVPEVSRAPAGRLLDIGTGGGLPGIPLSVVGHRDAVLLDSVAKKAAAVDAFVQREGLDVQVLGIRSEELAREQPHSFAVVVARAVAQLPSIVELAAPLLINDGHLVCLKGSPSAEELEAGERAARMVGLKPIDERKVALPRGGETRTILTYRRISEATILLPRRNGRAQSHPLA